MKIAFLKSFFLLLFLLPILLFSQDKNFENKLRVSYIINIKTVHDSIKEDDGSFQKTIQFLKEEKYRKAIHLAERKQKKQPQAGHWYFVQAIAYKHLNKTKKIEAIFKEAFDKLPATALLYYNYGIKKMYDGKYADADQFFQQSIQLEPTFVEAHKALSKVHELQGNRIKAILPLYIYFLFLPEGESNENELNRLKSLLFQGINVIQENGLTFSLPFSKEDKEMFQMELMLNELNSLFNKQDHLFGNRLLAFSEAIFSYLNENREAKSDIWWSFYANILGEISENNHTAAYITTELKNKNQGKEEIQLKEINKYLEWKANL